MYVSRSISCNEIIGDDFGGSENSGSGLAGFPGPLADRISHRRYKRGFMYMDMVKIAHRTRQDTMSLHIIVILKIV